jgi:predicted nicotinamide N-methyase
MKNSFLDHPEFLEQDFRANKPPNCGVPYNNNITVMKHELLLSPERVAGKRILDIGSFIGQTADWCLANGASHVTGVEISKEFCATATDLLGKYYDPDRYTIINQGLDDFFANNTEKFDIVFCWGVIFGHHDHVWFLNQLAQRGDHVIVESRHPKWMWNNTQAEISPEFWNDLEYNIPYTEWQTGNMTMLVAVNGSAYCTAANSSIAAIRLIMELAGFRADLSVYEKMKTAWPDNFGMIRDPKKIGRFMIEFYRDHTVKKHSLTDNIFKDSNEWNKNYVDWLAKK